MEDVVAGLDVCSGGLGRRASRWFFCSSIICVELSAGGLGVSPRNNFFFFCTFRLRRNVQKSRFLADVQRFPTSTYTPALPHLLRRHAILLGLQFDKREGTMVLLIKFLGFLLRQDRTAFIGASKNFALHIVWRSSQNQVGQGQIGLALVRIHISTGKAVYSLVELLTRPLQQRLIQQTT